MKNIKYCLYAFVPYGINLLLKSKGMSHLGVTEKSGVIIAKHQLYNAFYLIMAGNPRDFQP